jgi:hypothetical protein
MKQMKIGYQNWLALRQEWKRRPDGWQPAKRKPVDADQVRTIFFFDFRYIFGCKFSIALRKSYREESLNFSSLGASNFSGSMFAVPQSLFVFASNHHFLFVLNDKNLICSPIVAQCVIF